MASSKKTGEEKAKRKTKPTNPENKNRKKQKPTSKKPKSHTTTSNGAVKKPEVVVVPASSSSADSQQREPESQQDSEQERENRTEEASHQRSKTKIPKKTTHNRDKDEDENNDEEEEKACRFPTRRIRRIVKSQSSGSSITGDAVFLVNKATEKFLEQFCEDGYAQCVKDRKKSLSYQHLASVVSKQRRYDFLSDFVPEKIKAEAALAESKLTEKGAG